MVNPAIKSILPAAVFVIAAGLTYFGVTHWPKTETPNTGTTDTIADIDGLVAGEVIQLPELTSRDGKSTALNTVATDKLLLAFFAPSCPGCASDAGFWKSLNEESSKRGAAFYLIDVGQDRDARDKFVMAHDLGRLPILFDDNRQIGQTLKVNIVPQYLLVSNEGKVLHRWDGIRRFDKTPSPPDLAKFFESGKGE
jgi:peroxiredoxin